jgi:gliding motility-associated protein GldM
MAGGKLTPRQKMINLMYLVFIAMLALNMSKEVLSAFGLMNEKFNGINAAQTEQNSKLSQLLSQKAGENPGFALSLALSKQVNSATNEFYEFIERVKNEDILKDFQPENGVLPYEAMDKSNIDEKWFQGDGYSKRGQEIIDKINGYRNKMKSLLGKDVKYQSLLSKIDRIFNTDKIKDREGVSKLYLDYHYKGFPSIASVAKLTALQNDLKTIENESYNIFLGNAYKEAASMKNFQAIVVLDKNAYFEGETITGKVVLGRYDKNTVPTSFQGPGKIENGQAVISMSAGGVGEHKLGGKFTFMEDGKPEVLDFEGTYVVVPRPNSANISADKMNVVYRGLPNPMTISFAGIPDNNVTASAPGLSSAGGKGKYNLSPTMGTEVTINVTGKMGDGKTVADKKVFRIKNIPGPQGAIGGVIGDTKGAKSRLEVSQVSAMLPDFLYDLKFRVTQFTFKVPGQPAIIVAGDRVNEKCRAALARAGRGDQVVISDIKTKIEGVEANIITGKCSPVVYEIQ